MFPQARGAGSADDPLLGRIVAGRYRLESLLGVGALGAVYRARHLLIDRTVAIKVLQLAQRQRAGAAAWFLREARAVNLVNHANIVEIYDFGETEDGLAYLVMELLEGELLADRIAAGPLAVAAALDIVEQTAAALARAHDLGIIHRDLKPEHIFLVDGGGRRDFVKLIDFGLAHLAQEERIAAEGSVLGTPDYWAPEQARGEDVGPAADLYSLGVIFFEMVTRRLPWSAGDTLPGRRGRSRSPAPDPRELRPELDAGVAKMIRRLMDEDPRQRYADTHHLLDDCRAAQRRLSGGEITIAPAEGPGPRPAASTDNVFRQIATWALRASSFSRMAAVAYPGGDGPHQLRRELDRLWQAVADLSRLEGELYAEQRWEENLHSREREFKSQVGRKIEDLSHASSRLQREIAHGGSELDRQGRLLELAEGELREARAAIEASEVGADPEAVRQALAAAGAAAARRQVCLDAIAKVEGKLEKWQLARQQALAQADRYRAQLEQQLGRLEADLGSNKSAFAARLHDRDQRLADLAAAESFLAGHFAHRLECRGLLVELDDLTGVISGVEG